MASSSVWYAGRCVKRHEHEKLVYLEVVARCDEKGWTELDNPQRLFGGNNEVELRASDAKMLRVSDWVIFQLSGKGHKLWLVGEHRRLYRYADLATVGSAELVQRYLIAEGLKTPEPSGPWILRSNPTEVLKVDLRQVQGVAQPAGTVGKVPAFQFNPNSIINIQLKTCEVVLYDLGHEEVATTYDWSSDEAYVLRIVRSIADASDPRSKETITWLEEHAKRGDLLRPLDSADLAAAGEALRSGRLAKRLAADHLLLQSLVTALLDDPRVAGLIKAKTEEIASEERRAIRTKIESEIHRELEKARRQRLAALDAELNALKSKRQEEIEARQVEQVLIMKRELAKQKADEEAKIDHNLGVRKSKLEVEASELADKCSSLKANIPVLMAEYKELSARIQLLHTEEEKAINNLDRLIELAKFAQPQANVVKEKTRVPPVLLSTRGTPILIKDASELVTGSPLLSEHGKSLMLQFLALMLAGEVPALYGPDVEDFLLVAESLFASGTSARLEGDPTIITFEDLWGRPGTNSRTVLAEALTAAASETGDGRTVLAVVERAERSGARFWFPALAAHARRGDLPRRLLLCVTVEDEESEETVAIFSRTARLYVSSVLAPGAVLAAIAHFGEGIASELDPGERLQSLKDAYSVVVQHAQRLSVEAALRAARATVEMARLGTSTQGIACQASLVQLFLAAPNIHPTPVLNQSRSTIHA